MKRNAAELKGIEKISEDQADFYRDVLEAARKTGLPFALGGAFAWATYTSYLRNTKDIDLYVPKDLRHDFIHAVTSIGAIDYYDFLGYDRRWIYRSTRDGYIADIIWDMANYVRPLDDDYFNAQNRLTLWDTEYAVIPAEELILNKLYIMQRGRCDWFDVFNVLYCTKGDLDWERLIRKMGPDSILLASAINVFAWLCPGCVGLFPSDLWGALKLERPSEEGPDIVESRVNYLDSRPWFIPLLKPGEHPFAEGN